MIPKELKYTKEHEWVKVEGNEATFGITDHAQSELGDITFIELPQAGDEIKQFEGMGTIESVKAASDLYAPLSGKVTAVNTSLEDAPESINSSPYEEGWICKVSISDPDELEALLDASGYENFLADSE